MSDVIRIIQAETDVLAVAQTGPQGPTGPAGADGADGADAQFPTATTAQLLIANSGGTFEAHSVSGDITIDAGGTAALSKYSSGNAAAAYVTTLEASGDVEISADGATTSAPRILGISDLSSGEAARVQIGDPATILGQTAFGYPTVTGSYHQWVIHGLHRNSAGIAISDAYPMAGVVMVGSIRSGAGTAPILHIEDHANRIADCILVARGGAELFSVTHDGEIEIHEHGGGVILSSANGTRYKITVSDAGSIVTTAL